MFRRNRPQTFSFEEVEATLTRLGEHYEVQRAAELARAAEVSAHLARARKEATLQAELAATAVGQLAEIREQTTLRVAELKEARDREVKQLNRLVDTLAEQVEYLRAQLERTPKLGQVITPERGHPDVVTDLSLGLDYNDATPAYSEVPMWVPEEEEELRFLQEIGHIDTADLERELQKLGLNGPLDIDR